MGLFGHKRTGMFAVTVHCDGRHPYLDDNELDYPTKDVMLTVPASSWNDAERVALRAAFAVKAWRYSVTKIEAVRS